METTATTNGMPVVEKLVQVRPRRKASDTDQTVTTGSSAVQAAEEFVKQLDNHVAQLLEAKFAAQTTIEQIDATLVRLLGKSVAKPAESVAVLSVPDVGTTKKVKIKPVAAKTDTPRKRGAGITALLLDIVEREAGSEGIGAADVVAILQRAEPDMNPKSAYAVLHALKVKGKLKAKGKGRSVKYFAV